MKKRFKKALCLAIAVILLMAALPLSASASEEWVSVPGIVGGRVLFDSETGCIISFEDTVTSAAIPNQINGVTVTSFSAMFDGGDNLTSITIPSGMTNSYVPESLSVCKKLADIEVDSGNVEYCSVNGILFNKSQTTLFIYPAKKTDSSYAIPSSVTTIGYAAFSDNENLTSVTFSGNILMIGDAAFHGCVNLTDVTLPGSIKSIGKGAFSDCKAFTNLRIPQSVATIGNEAFAGCDKLTEIEVEGGNTAFCSVDGVLFDKQKRNLICCPARKGGTSYAVPSGVTVISASAFDNCSWLTDITFPNSVTNIGYSAFNGCSKLTSVTIPDSVTLIGKAAFPSAVTIHGKKGGYAEAYAKENGYTFIAAGGTNPNPPITPNPPVDPDSQPEMPFTDVKSSDYFCEAVKWAVEKEITSGTSDMQFSPDAPCTRGQAVTFLWRAAGTPEPVSSETGFSDVKSGAYYEKAVQWAVENGITSGTGNGKFSPEATCTRAQIVTFMYRAENSPAVSEGSSFSDVASTAYYKDAVQWAAENEITSGTGNGKFSPENKCVRGQIVTFLYRYSGE